MLSGIRLFLNTKTVEIGKAVTCYQMYTINL